MAPDLIDQIPGYEPDFGARRTVRFVPSETVKRADPPKRKKSTRARTRKALR